MMDVDVIEDPARAMVALDPVKRRILEALATPASAASLAPRIGLTRQKANYHLRVLEDHGLVKAAEQRQWGGLTERVMVASAAAYVVSPAALGDIAVDPARTSDRLSASYLIALGSRIVGEVGRLWAGARKADKRLATLSIDTVIRFKSAADRAQFTGDLTHAVAALAARYHHDGAAGGRVHRLVVAAYPAPSDDNAD